MDLYARFRKNSPYLALDRTRLENSKMKFMHLHGSYKFAKVFGMTCKISGVAENKNPVMVFNRPTQKGNLVRGDDVLNTYFEKLRRDLSTCDKFIILGNSMKNEPHIKELLSNSIREDATIVVCSRNPSEIRAEIAPHVKCTIEEATTRDIMTEEGLTEFLKNVLA
jgi:NAD-dependent SIR2 family protein deacetylase